MAIIRRPIRSWPIRLFLIGMFAVPLVSLIGLWAFAASVTVPESVSDHNYNLSGLVTTSPDVAAVTIQVPTEQHETYLWLLSGRRASKSSLLTTRATIDKVLPGAEATLLAGDNQLTASAKADLNALEADTELADVLGGYFVSSFLAYKRNELERFERYVTDWEFREYAYHL